MTVTSATFKSSLREASYYPHLRKIKMMNECLHRYLMCIAESLARDEIRNFQNRHPHQSNDDHVVLIKGQGNQELAGSMTDII